MRHLDDQDDPEWRRYVNRPSSAALLFLLWEGMRASKDFWPCVGLFTLLMIRVAARLAWWPWRKLFVKFGWLDDIPFFEFYESH